MVEHHVSAHPGITQISYEMKVTKVECRNLYRQAREGLQIETSKADTLLNSRGDWGQNLPPKLVVENERVKRNIEGVPKRPLGGAKTPTPPSHLMSQKDQVQLM